MIGAPEAGCTAGGHACGHWAVKNGPSDGGLGARVFRVVEEADQPRPAGFPSDASVARHMGQPDVPPEVDAQAASLGEQPASCGRLLEFASQDHPSLRRLTVLLKIGNARSGLQHAQGLQMDDVATGLHMFARIHA